MTKKKPESLTDQIRRAIDLSGVSRYRISQETGISEQSLSVFYWGKGLSMDNLDKLAECLKLTVNIGRKDGE